MVCNKNTSYHSNNFYIGVWRKIPINNIFCSIRFTGMPQADLQRIESQSWNFNHFRNRQGKF